MRCEDCLPTLEEYFDGEMSRRDADRVATHLAGCARCFAAFSSLSAEQQVYSRYRRDVEVTPAMWAAIRERIATHDDAASSGLIASVGRWIASTLVAPRLSPAAVLLLIAIAIAGTIWLTNMGRTRTAPEQVATSDRTVPATPVTSPSPEVTETPLESAGEPGKESPHENEKIKIAKMFRRAPHGRVTTPRTAPTADQLVREAEEKYLAAIAILNRDVQRQRRRMDPQVVARLDDAIAGIDRTIADTRRALKQNPGDTLAFEYMLTAYARKVDLLRDIANY